MISPTNGFLIAVFIIVVPPICMVIGLLLGAAHDKVCDWWRRR